MNFFVDRYIGLADFIATVNRLTSFDEAFARTPAAFRDKPHVVAQSLARRGARHSRARAQPARWAQARAHRQSRAGAAGADAVHRSERRGQVDAVPRDRRPVALWQGRDLPARPRQADAAAAAALSADRPVARGARLSLRTSSSFTDERLRDALVRGRAAALVERLDEKRQLADAAFGRRAAAARASRARCSPSPTGCSSTRRPPRSTRRARPISIGRSPKRCRM